MKRIYTFVFFTLFFVTLNTWIATSVPRTSSIISIPSHIEELTKGIREDMTFSRSDEFGYLPLVHGVLEEDDGDLLIYNTVNKQIYKRSLGSVLLPVAPAIFQGTTAKGQSAKLTPIHTFNFYTVQQKEYKQDINNADDYLKVLSEQQSLVYIKVNGDNFLGLEFMSRQLKTFESLDEISVNQGFESHPTMLFQLRQREDQFSYDIIPILSKKLMEKCVLGVDRVTTAISLCGPDSVYFTFLINGDMKRSIAGPTKDLPMMLIPTKKEYLDAKQDRSSLRPYETFTLENEPIMLSLKDTTPKSLKVAVILSNIKFLVMSLTLISIVMVLGFISYRKWQRRRNIFFKLASNEVQLDDHVGLTPSTTLFQFSPVNPGLENVTSRPLSPKKVHFGNKVIHVDTKESQRFDQGQGLMVTQSELIYSDDDEEDSDQPKTTNRLSPRSRMMKYESFDAHT